MARPLRLLLPLLAFTLPLPAAANCLGDTVSLAQEAGISLAPPYAQAQAHSATPPTAPATAESQGFVEDDTSPMPEAGDPAADGTPAPDIAALGDTDNGDMLDSREYVLLRSAMIVAEGGDEALCRALLEEARAEIADADTASDAAED